jgi:hypothetical protein
MTLLIVSYIKYVLCENKKNVLTRRGPGREAVKLEGQATGKCFPCPNNQTPNFASSITVLQISLMAFSVLVLNMYAC